MAEEKRWKKILAKVAPALGTAIGGPFGALAGGIIGQVLTGKKDNTEEELALAIEHATPEQYLELQRMNKQFEKDMAALQVDVFALEVKDKGSAREMFKVNFWPQVILSGIYNIGYFIVLFLILRGKVASALAPELQGAFLTLLGVLTAAIPQINGFWFGSSFGSKEKTMALAGSAPVNGARNGG